MRIYSKFLAILFIVLAQTLIPTGANAADGYGYVGGGWINLPGPTPPVPGATIYSEMWSSSSSHLAVSNSLVKILSYYTGNEYVECSYWYAYSTPNGGENHAQGKAYYTIACNEVKLFGIPSNLTMQVGETQTIDWTYSPPDVIMPVLSWSSSDYSVVEVNSNKITAKKRGTATITVKSNAGPTQYISVSVSGGPDIVYVSSITLNEASLTMNEGNTRQLEATVLPNNATDKSVSWSSSNTSVATVTILGLVTAKSAGSTTITCKANDGSEKSASCIVTVKSSTVEPVSIVLPNYTENIKVGESITLVPTMAPSNATTTLTWTSSNTSVATVSQSGVVKGIKAGESKITVTTSNGKSAYCYVKVSEDVVYVSSISLNSTSVTLTEGDTKQLSATVSPSNATDKSVSWSSSNTSVATVSASGLVTAKSTGSTTITCKANDGSGKSATCSVTVKSAVVEPTSISVSPSSKTVKVGDAFYCGYTLSPSNATTTVTWFSDNSSIATVTSSGKVTAKSVGSTYINARTANGKTDWCKVTVESATLPKLTLSASPSGGMVPAWSKVTLTSKANGSTVSGCDIYYTTDGSTPTKSSKKYTSAGITIYPACTLKAIAYKSGYETSDVLTTNYAVELFLSASPSGGSVGKGTKVYISARDEDGNDLPADIYYTLNGSTPTQSSTKYTSSGITINSNCTLKAIAYNYDIVSSDVLTATYTIKENPKPKLTLSASPSGGQVTSGTTVTLTAKANGSTVSGCDIYFTTNGSNPSRNNGTKYSSGVTINSNCTLKAIAYKDGYETSDVLSMTYTIKQYQKLYLLASPNSGQVPKGAVVALTAAGDQKESFVEVKSGNMVYGSWDTCFWIVFPQENAFHKGDKWQVSMRVRAEKEANSETQIHKNPDEYLWYQGIGDVTFTTEWCTYANSGTFSVNQDGGYSICFKLNCFEDANTYYFDDISFKINGIELISNGSCDDANGTVKYYSKENNATIVPSRIVTIITGSNTISDCDIYYTINGSTPTKSSTKYTSSGITISEACTLKAIAYKKGFEASDILTENYTIKKVNEEIVVATCVGIIMGDNGQTYRVTGIVESIENIALGYWYLKDSTGIIYIHGTRDEDGSPFYALHKRGIEVGDVVTVEGLKASNNGQTELENVRIVNSNPSDINDVQTTGRIETSVFSLSGQRLAAPRKGINIIGGRKVVVK